MTNPEEEKPAAAWFFPYEVGGRSGTLSDLFKCLTNVGKQHQHKGKTVVPLNNSGGNLASQPLKIKSKEHRPMSGNHQLVWFGQGF